MRPPKWALLLSFFVYHNGALACSVLFLSSEHHFGTLHYIQASLASTPNFRANSIRRSCNEVKNAHSLELAGLCLIITMGKEALDVALRYPTKTPILAVLIREKAFRRALLEHDYTPEDIASRITAVYLDQPIERQVHLAQALLSPGQRGPIGVLAQHSDDDQTLLAFFRRHPALFVPLSSQAHQAPIKALEQLLDKVDLLMTFPDSDIYHAKTARGILLTAFHKRVPVIGYSHSCVKNGALAAIYTTRKQIAEQTAETIIQILTHHGEPLPLPQYAKTFTISLNPQVAYHLGVAIKPISALKYELDRRE